MKKFKFHPLIIIISLLSLSYWTSCRSKQQTPAIPTVTLENTTDTRFIHTETIDTILIHLPAQTAERTTPDRHSRLETDYAFSDARINDDGTLTHTLANKPTPHTVPVKSTADTITRDRLIEIPVPVEKPVPVERDLTTWQQLRLSTWPYLLALLLLSLAWTLRRPLLTLLRRLT